MVPAHQGFRTRQNRLVRTDIILGLEVYLEAVVFQGGSEIFQKTFPVQLCFMHFLIINADRYTMAALHCIGGDLRIVKAALDLERFINL